MNSLDIFLAVILGIGFFRGFTRGFILELFSLISLVVGIFLAYHGSGILVDFIRAHWAWEFAQMHVLAFIFILVVVIVIFQLLGKGLTKLSDIISLGLLNRILGGFFNLLKTALILSLVINVWLWFNTVGGLGQIPFTENSKLYPSLQKLVPGVYQIWKEHYETPETENPEQTL